MPHSSPFLLILSSVNPHLHPRQQTSAHSQTKMFIKPNLPALFWIPRRRAGSSSSVFRRLVRIRLESNHKAIWRLSGPLACPWRFSSPI